MSSHVTTVSVPPQSGPSSALGGRLHSVQYLRATAALTVTLSHMVGDIAYHGGPNLFGAYYVGAAGVDLFFVISGFVMVYASRNLFTGRAAQAVFLWRRLLRIVPLYWLATGVYALVQIGQGKWSVVRPDLVATSLVFWPYADAEGLHLPVYGIGWTLDYEMFFYLAFAFGLPFRRRIGLSLVAGGLLGLVLLGTRMELPQPLRFLANPILVDFLLGMGLGALYLGSWRMGPRLATAAFFLAGGLFLAATLAGFNAVPNVPDRFPRWVAWGLPAALFFAGTVLRNSRSKALRPSLLLLGDASYALYLLHPLVIIAMRPLLPVLLAGLAGAPAGLVVAAVLFLLANLIIVVMGAVAIHLLFERPLARWLGRGRPRQAALAIADGSGPVGGTVYTP